MSTGLAFRLAPRLELEFELAYARKLDFVLDLCPTPGTCGESSQRSVTGRSVSLVPQLVVDLLPRRGRVRIYAQAGLGAGHVRQRYYTSPPPRTSDDMELTRSNVVFAWAIGGGATIDLTRRFAIGVDVRTLQLHDAQPTAERFITPAGRLSTLRLGSRVAWRF